MSLEIIIIIIIGCFIFTSYILRDVSDMGLWYTQVHYLWTVWLETEQSAVLLAVFTSTPPAFGAAQCQYTAVSAAVAMLY